jgi:hypothetical protein
MALRESHIREIEVLTGTLDVLKGEKPPGVDSFSGLQLLIEQAQGRLTAARKSRGEMIQRWFSIAIELERQFGPEERVHAVISPNKGYTFKYFENAKLQGQITVRIEDGSNMPKTALGMRANLEQGQKLGVVDPQDPEQRREMLSMLGLQGLNPTLNFHVQTILQLQDQFEQWALSGGMTDGQPTPPPLVWKPWYEPMIHLTEMMKWLNTDRMKDILSQNPNAEAAITQYLLQVQQMTLPPPVDEKGNPLAQAGAGSAQAMANSNQNAGSTGNLAQGNQQGQAQDMGPI